MTAWRNRQVKQRFVVPKTASRVDGAATRVRQGPEDSGLTASPRVFFSPFLAVPDGLVAEPYRELRR